MAKISFIPHQDSPDVLPLRMLFNFAEGTMTSWRTVSEQIILTPCFFQYNYINVFDRIHEFRVSALQLKG